MFILGVEPAPNDGDNGMGPDVATTGGSSPKISVGFETATWIGDGAPDPMDFGLILELLELRVRFREE